MRGEGRRGGRRRKVRRKRTNKRTIRKRGREKEKEKEKRDSVWSTNTTFIYLASHILITEPSRLTRMQYWNACCSVR